MNDWGRHGGSRGSRKARLGGADGNRGTAVPPFPQPTTTTGKENKNDGRTSEASGLTTRPPNRVRLKHKLIVEAVDTAGNVGRREIPFVVRNGPGIAVLGIRPNEIVEGTLDLRIDAFSSGANQNFNSAQAESQRPIPVAAWVLLAVFSMWAMYYGIANFFPPAAFATGLTSESNPFTKANAPAAAGTNVSTGVQPNGNAAGFDYATTGPQIYAANCAGCHGAEGAGVPGAFPALAGDPVVNAPDAKAHITTVLHGLHGKVIGSKAYGGEMPAYRTQLTDAEVAAVIDHERTSWGNKRPVVTPDVVKALR